MLENLNQTDNKEKTPSKLPKSKEISKKQKQQSESEPSK